MRNVLFVLVSAMAFAMNTPSSAQGVYDPAPHPMLPGSFGSYRTDDYGRLRSDTWRDQRDWREHRNDWRQSSPDEWRRSRNDWKDADDWRPRYSIGEEEALARERAKARAKARAYDDDEDGETRRVIEDEYSGDCNATNSWRGQSSSGPCR